MASAKVPQIVEDWGDLLGVVLVATPQRAKRVEDKQVGRLFLVQERGDLIETTSKVEPFRCVERDAVAGARC